MQIDHNFDAKYLFIKNLANTLTFITGSTIL